MYIFYLVCPETRNKSFLELDNMFKPRPKSVCDVSDTNSVESNSGQSEPQEETLGNSSRGAVSLLYKAKKGCKDTIGAEGG